MKSHSLGQWPGAKALASGIPVYCAHTRIEKLSSLIPNARNPNQHPKEQIRLLAKVIGGGIPGSNRRQPDRRKGNGWRNAIVISSLSGMITKGHARYEAAKLMGVAEVPIDVQHYGSLEEEFRDLIADNRIAELAEMDDGLLSILLQELKAKGEDLDLCGFDKDEVARLLETTEAAIDEALTTKRTRIEWDKFKIFHCVVGEQIYCLDRVHYLVSYGTMEGKPPIKKKGIGSLVFIDSGMLTLARKIGIKATKKQADVLEYAEKLGADWVTMMDIPQVPGILKSLKVTRSQAYKIHLENARQFAGFKSSLRKVFVAQGQTLEQYRQCCQDMKELVRPSDVVAIGSIKDRADNPQLIAAITSTVSKIFPKNDLHLFGVTAPVTVRQAMKYGATSADSSIAGNATRFGEFLFASRVEKTDVFKIDSKPLGQLMGIPELSIDSKLWVALSQFAITQVEATLGLSFCMEEAAVAMTAGHHTTTGSKATIPEWDPNNIKPKLVE